MRKLFSGQLCKCVCRYDAVVALPQEPHRWLSMLQTQQQTAGQCVPAPRAWAVSPSGPLPPVARSVKPCKDDTCGLLARYPVTASGFHLMGKETERGWEQSEDVSTLLPLLLRYENQRVVPEQLKQRLLRIPLDVLERETGLSRHTILRARRGERVHPRSLQVLKTAVHPTTRKHL